MSEPVANGQFLEDVLKGLRAPHKFLSSKYFYDHIGDELFQRIMKLEEYYLTDKELNIFETHKDQILESMRDEDAFRIIELGAGDGSKTKVLLKHFMEMGIDFTYTPVDISGNVLQILEDNLKNAIPGIKVESYQGEYFQALDQISTAKEKDVVFFLGSNVGNFSEENATVFLKRLNGLLKPGDQLFMGVDLKKDPSVILSAYNDSEGVTRRFNLNLLSRINRELDADFEIENFLHYPYYNPHTGECRSYLISKEHQRVSIGENQIDFRKWEAIFMEISKKYDSVQLQGLADATGFISQETFTDGDDWFADVLWEK